MLIVGVRGGSGGTDIQVVLDKLKSAFNEVESERKGPNSGWKFGYESHHLVCMIPPLAVPIGWNDLDDMPKTFELQVRTLFMHAWAEPQHDLGYKGPEDIPVAIQREWAWAAAAAWNGDQTLHGCWNGTRRVRRDGAGSDANCRSGLRAALLRRGVRDVVQLHIRAMTSPEAKGQRFIAVSGECLSMLDIAKVLNARASAPRRGRC
jgi:hypothetical protein